MEMFESDKPKLTSKKDPMYVGTYSAKDLSYILPRYTKNGETNVVFPEITITPENTDLNLAMVNKGKLGVDLIKNFSPIGDITDIMKTGKLIYDGDYLEAAQTAGLSLLPRAMSKPFKRVFKNKITENTLLNVFGFGKNAGVYMNNSN